jgi:hypothetical protein
MLQASLARIVQFQGFWSVKKIPNVVLELLEEIPLADHNQYYVPFTEAISGGELRQSQTTQVGLCNSEGYLLSKPCYARTFLLCMALSSSLMPLFGCFSG